MDIVKFIIEQKPSNQFDWENAFHNACKSGHMDIVNLIIEKGSKS